MAITSGSGQLFRDGGSMSLSQVENAPRGFGGFDADLDHPSKKELEPDFPVALFPDRLQPVVVCLPVTLEVVRQVQDWFLQQSSLGQQERDEEAADASVTIERCYRRAFKCV